MMHAPIYAQADDTIYDAMIESLGKLEKGLETHTKGCADVAEKFEAIVK